MTGKIMVVFSDGDRVEVDDIRMLDVSKEHGDYIAHTSPGLVVFNGDKVRYILAPNFMDPDNADPEPECEDDNADPEPECEDDECSTPEEDTVSFLRRELFGEK